ncbi:MAG: dsbD [Moraxellaceae bacterium]|jgi:thiol:disulfide interchange protein|nr:dsbD [Moraxellaceae bacterium]
MKLILILLSLSLVLGVPGLWLLLRRSGRQSLAAGTLLLLTSTALGYIGGRLWLDTSTEPAPSFVRTTPAGHFQVIMPAQLPAALTTANGQPVLLEFYADWCTSCLVWKKEVFSRSDVQGAMKPLVLLQVDATELTPDVQALLDQYGLAGLPALLVFDRSGRERPELRLLGEMPAADFIEWINAKLLPAM